MNHDEYQSEVDHLALGLTRSPMFMGVSIKLFFANLVVCTLICIDAHTFLGVPLFVVFHLIIVRLSMKEPEFLKLYAKSFIKTPPVLNRWVWGANSYEPW